MVFHRVLLFIVTECGSKQQKTLSAAQAYAFHNYSRKNLSIMPALCLMLDSPYSAQNYPGILLCLSLPVFELCLRCPGGQEGGSGERELRRTGGRLVLERRFVSAPLGRGSPPRWWLSS